MNDGQPVCAMVIALKSSELSLKTLSVTNLLTKLLLLRKARVSPVLNLTCGTSTAVMLTFLRTAGVQNHTEFLLHPAPNPVSN